MHLLLWVVILTALGAMALVFGLSLIFSRLERRGKYLRVAPRRFSAFEQRKLY